jgi:hypothetical protein
VGALVLGIGDSFVFFFGEASSRGGDGTGPEAIVGWKNKKPRSHEGPGVSQERISISAATNLAVCWNQGLVAGWALMVARPLESEYLSALGALVLSLSIIGDRLKLGCRGSWGNRVSKRKCGRENSSARSSNKAARKHLHWATP